MREIEHEQLLGRIAHGPRVIHHQRVIGDPLEQISGGDVADVERRVLAHQHDVNVGGQVERLEFTRAEMIAFDPLDGRPVAPWH